MIIKTKKLLLRPPKKGDESDIARNINDKEIYRFTLRIPYPYKKPYARKWINELSRKKDEIVFVAELGGEVIGACGLHEIEKNHKAEIGYWLAKKHWGKGLGTEISRSVTNFGFKKLKLKRIYATVFKGNKASARILEKNGYRLEGTLRKYRMKEGKLLDVWMYAKVR